MFKIRKPPYMDLSSPQQPGVAWRGKRRLNPEASRISDIRRLNSEASRILDIRRINSGAAYICQPSSIRTSIIKCKDTPPLRGLTWRTDHPIGKPLRAV